MTPAGTADFASAAMVRVLARGMQSLGLAPPGLPEAGGATVPLDLKRALVQAAVAQGGMACLPLLGRGVRDLAMEPTHLALTAGHGAADLLVRWQRLERYIHSRHRIQVLGLTDRSAQVRHLHRDQGPAPLPAEDLVVCGVLCALLEANGLQGVQAHAAGVPLYPQPRPHGVVALVQQGQTATWDFTWQASTPTPALPDSAPAWSRLAPPLWSALARTLGDRVARRLPDLLPLEEAAGSVGMAVRSLQRALSADGLSYTQLVAEVRLRLVGWYLVQTSVPIAEAGYVCGYADQAHLTREFNRRMGMPPARYRSSFERA